MKAMACNKHEREHQCNDIAGHIRIYGLMWLKLVNSSLQLINVEANESEKAERKEDKHTHTRTHTLHQNPNTKYFSEKKNISSKVIKERDLAKRLPKWDKKEAETDRAIQKVGTSGSKCGKPERANRIKGAKGNNIITQCWSNDECR